MDPIQQQFAAMASMFAAQLPERLEAMNLALSDALADAVSEADKVRDGLDTLQKEAHKIVGSGATFGFPDLSDSARLLEQRCQVLKADMAALNGSGAGEVKALFDDVARLIGEAVESKAGTVAAGDLNEDAVRSAPAVPETQPTTHVNNTEGPSDGGEVELQGSASDAPCLALKGLATVEMARLSVELERLGVLVTDKLPANDAVDVSAGGEAGRDRFKAVLFDADLSPDYEHTFACPLFAIGDSRNFTARLVAARAGVAAFFPRPVRAADLVAALQDHKACSRSDVDVSAPRILLTEDDLSIGRYIQLVLEKAGYGVEIVGSGEEALACIQKAPPHLLITDFNLPDCSGAELAAVVRQMGVSRVPVLVLSGDGDNARRVEALGGGASVFLTKPVRGPDLIEAVRLLLGQPS